MISHKHLLTYSACFFMLAVPASLYAKSHQPTDTKQTSHAITWENVQTSSPDSAISYPGTITACKKTKLAFRVAGPLVQVNVNPGDVVKKGQLLMQIDPQDFRDKIAVLNTQLQAAKSRLTTAKMDFKRAQTLFDQKVIPQADFDHMVNGQQLAAAQVSQVKAQLTIARHHLSYTSLKAPYDGIIIGTTVENHEMVGPGIPVVIIHDISVLEITAGVPENELIRHPLNPDTKALVTFPALGDEKFTAKLKEWNTSADPATKTFGVTFSMKAPKNQRILPGMTAELTWSDNKKARPVITVPTKAISMNPNGSSMVWIYNPDTGKARRREISVGGFAGDNRTIVLSGLTPNEKIVTSGMDFITEYMNLSSASGQQEENK